MEGKTKLQKLIYFLGVVTGREQELGYRPHFYGPYSPDVADAMDLLAAREFVKLSHAGVGGVDSRGFELVRTDYVLTSDGERIATAKAKENSKLVAAIADGARVVGALKDRDYMKLSIAAKTYFMLKANPKADLPSLAKRFGWSVTPRQIEEAKQMLASVNLDPAA